MEFLYCADTAVARVLSMPGVGSAGTGHRPLLFVFNCIPCSLLLIEVEEQNLRKSVPDVSDLL